MHILLFLHFLGSGGGGDGGGFKSEVGWTGVEGLCAHVHGCSSCACVHVDIAILRDFKVL